MNDIYSRYYPPTIAGMGDTSAGGPRDATTPTGLSLCAVCQEVSDNHHLHYGALCCFSCRAFFRRANQTAGKVYVCKQDGKCDVSKKNRKKCQKCRYEACLRVGMDPGLVLTEDQKKARFRKMLEKKAETTNGVSRARSTSESQRRPSYQPQLSAPSTLDGVQMSKTRRDESLGNVKRRRTIPPNWSTTEENFGSVDGDHQLEVICNPVEGNLESLEKLLTISDLQTDTLQEVEATLSLMQGSKFDSSYYMYQQQQYQLQQRVYPQVGFFPEQNNHFQNCEQAQNEFQYRGDPASFKDVYEIKQENEEGTELQTRQLQKLAPAPYMSNADPYDPDSFIQSLQNYFDGSNNDDISTLSENRVIEQEKDPFRRMMQTFNRAASMVLGQESDLVQSLLGYHCSASSISKYDARRLITCLAETFRQFAMSQNKFQSLSSDDQLRLLALTRPLFVHYILGQYFTHSASGSSQVLWLLGEEKTAGFSLCGAVAKSIIEFNREVGLFMNQNSALRYATAAVNGLSRLRVNPKHNGIVAALLLFSVESHNEFDNPECIRSECEDLLQKLSQCRYGSMLGVTKEASRLQGDESLRVPFVDTLHVLRDIFMEQVPSDVDKMSMSTSVGISHYAAKCRKSPEATVTSGAELTSGEETCTNISTSSSPKLISTPPATPSSPTTSSSSSTRSSSTSKTCSSVSLAKTLLNGEGDVKISPEEEEWVNNQLVKFNSSYKQVSLGEDFVKEFVMFSYDVPLSKQFASKAYSVFAERFKKILEVHPGFDKLTEQEQSAIWKGGCAKAVACCSAKMSCMQSGGEQLEFLLGEDDWQQWRDNYSGLKVSKIKKIRMSDCNKVSSILDTTEMMEYLRLVGSLGEVTTDEDVFKMLVLLSLFSGDDLPESVLNFVNSTRNGYLKMLSRKLRCDRRTMSKIVVSLADIDELARILRKLDLNEPPREIQSTC